MISAINTIESIVNSMESDVTFYADNWEGIRNDIANVQYDKEKDGKDFPIIVLDTNYKREQGNIIGVGLSFDAKFYVVWRTDSEYNNKDRDNESFLKYGYPLKNEFLYYALRSTRIMFDIQPLPKAYKKNDGEFMVSINTIDEKLPYFRGKDVTQNMLNQEVDALSFELKLRIRN